MGKHHRKWFLDEPIASDERLRELIKDLEEYYKDEKSEGEEDS